MLLVLLGWCFSQDQLTSYKSFMTRIIAKNKKINAKNNGNDNDDDNCPFQKLWVTGYEF